MCKRLRVCDSVLPSVLGAHSSCIPVPAMSHVLGAGSREEQASEAAAEATPEQASEAVAEAKPERAAAAAEGGSVAE